MKRLLYLTMGYRVFTVKFFKLAAVILLADDSFF